MYNDTILNYPGSKRQLLDFIFDKSKQYIDKEKYILDIFAGTGCVAEKFLRNGYNVYANDAELYSYNISTAILGENLSLNLVNFKKNYNKNKDELLSIFGSKVQKEEELLLSNNNCTELERFDEWELPKIWQGNQEITLNGIKINSIYDLNSNISSIPFSLFTLYFAGYYFGLKQSIEIDSIRYAIEFEENKATLLTCLYFAMKECTFSKDGHMAQPLNHLKNENRLFKVRTKSIYDIFEQKLKEFMITPQSRAKHDTFNFPLNEIICNNDILENVGFIYADPPYTDMQYSRYFHLLNTVSNYSYPNMTLRHGELTTGLYTDNRFQSLLSNKSTALKEQEKLMDIASSRNITLAYSFAYPIDTESQATDRYVMSIDELIDSMNARYNTVDVYRELYSHCNNRNSSPKRVYEYLIVGHNNG